MATNELSNDDWILLRLAGLVSSFTLENELSSIFSMFLPFGVISFQLSGWKLKPSITDKPNHYIM